MTKMQTVRAPKRVVALIYDGLCTFEYGIATEVFGLSRPELGDPLYTFKSVALEDGPMRAAGGLNVQATGSRDDFDAADLIVIAGWRGVDVPIPHVIVDAMRAAHARGARFLTICSGGYVLAAAGLLDGCAATTHWRYCDDFQARFDGIKLRSNALYVDAGQVVTSAGSSAGIDACLHIVRQDYGAKVANSVARRLVMHAYRQGDQAQFIEQPVPTETKAHQLSDFMQTVRDQLAAPHDIVSMATLAGMSPRTFQRRFLGYTGVPAMQWLTQERMARCCELLETTDLSVDVISYDVGFGGAEKMRYHFQKTLGVTPLEHRKRFCVTG